MLSRQGRLDDDLHRDTSISSRIRCLPGQSLPVTGGVDASIRAGCARNTVLPVVDSVLLRDGTSFDQSFEDFPFDCPRSMGLAVISVSLSSEPCLTHICMPEYPVPQYLLLGQADLYLAHPIRIAAFFFGSRLLPSFSSWAISSVVLDGVGGRK